MADYNILVFCDHCGGTHPLPFHVSLSDGPGDPSAIDDAYKGRDLPPALADALTHKVHCDATNKTTLLRDPQKQSFLVQTDREVKGRQFANQRVILDGGRFFDCTFTKCALLFGGTAAFQMTDCNLLESQWTWFGPALQTILLLETLREFDPSVFGQMIDHLRAGDFHKKLDAMIASSSQSSDGLNK